MNPPPVSRRSLIGGTAALATFAPELALAQIPDRSGKIVEVRLHTMRLIRDHGAVPAAPGFRGREGGETILELVTADGLSGIAPGIDRAQLDPIRQYLVGKSPFPIQRHVRFLEARNNGVLGRTGASVEVALWDIVGKLLNRPLFELWGGATNKIVVYSSMMSRGPSIPERTEAARRVQAEGWKAVKLRPHWENTKDDIRLVESVRKACGDDFRIMADANQASGANPSGVSWDFKRAAETAKAYEALGVEWLEEPLPRENLGELAELNGLLTMYLAGGETNGPLREFRDYITRGCYDIVQPEVMNVGPTRLLEVGSLARIFNRKCVPHEGFRGIGSLCQLHFAASSGAYVAEVLNDPPVGDYRFSWATLQGAPEVDRAGSLTLPSEPGLGVSIRRDLIESSEGASRP